MTKLRQIAAAADGWIEEVNKSPRLSPAKALGADRRVSEPEAAAIEENFKALPAVLRTWVHYAEWRYAFETRISRHMAHPADFKRDAIAALQEVVKKAAGTYAQVRLARLLNAALQVAGEPLISPRALLQRRLRRR